MYKSFFKRTIDITASAGLLLVFCVPLAFVTLWLKLANKGGGAFFKQQRPGKAGIPFYIVKFKTMNDKKDPDGKLLPDKQRITKIGSFIRNTSIDELPQLWNVLKGEMSLIGPRPLLMEYLPLYSTEQMRRHDVRPGITGWAQVHGRNNISFTERFKYDVWYVDNLSFLTDCKVIFSTIKKVIKREDISQQGYVTSEPFNGKN